MQLLRDMNYIAGLAIDHMVYIYNYHVDTFSIEVADKVSARAGHSEHQTGLAMDVTSVDVNNILKKEFGSTAGVIYC